MHTPNVKPTFKLIASLLIMSASLAFPSHAEQSSCAVPFQENITEPAIDLIGADGKPIDPDRVIDLVNQGKDTSSLEPQVSDLYLGRSLPIQDEETRGTFPQDPSPTLVFDSELAGTSGLVRARVYDPANKDRAYQLQFSLDSHATLARNALMRKLGYAIPAPQYYPKASVTFKSLVDRDLFLDHLADNTLTSRGRWVVGGIEEVNKNQLTLLFQDVLLESALITLPPLHWGILSTDLLQSRRSIRALIVPLTLLDVPESVNMYSFEAAKIYSDAVVFSRPNADQFKNNVSIGDVMWMAKKIALFDRNDWVSIVKAAHYPPDIEALIIEKTIGRVDQLMKLLAVKPFKKLPYTAKISSGAVIKGKATQEAYDGYAARFAYGDPQSPLRASELLRFFAIEGISAGLQGAIGEANKYMQILSPDTYVKEHQADFTQMIEDHQKYNPTEPFIQPIAAWGGPIAGVNINASRNVVTGTYYGSTSTVQLVDSVSAGVTAGAFMGVSGLKYGGFSDSLQVQFQRSYVHVRPVGDIKTAFKDSWAHLLVPLFMAKLGKVLTETEERTSAQAMQEFLDGMKPGEMFIINDSVTASNSANFVIPIGALLGGVGVLLNITESVGVNTQIATLSRTTIYRDEEGIHVYLGRMKSGQFEVVLDTNFYIKVLSLSGSAYGGTAHTDAYIFPEKFEKVEDQRSFIRAMRAIVRKTNPTILQEEFKPFVLDHKNKGFRLKIAVGPFSWTRRENFHELEITPPESKDTRSVIEGQITKIKGSDIYGFFGSVLHTFVPYVNLGGGGRGDDPSSNFLGRSNTMSIGSQMEITKGRPNKFVATLSRSYKGWIMKKNRLLKLIAKMQSKLGEYAQDSSLVNPDEFSQTKSVQAYSVSWNLMIYEKGMKNLLDLLDFEKTSTKEVQNTLVRAMGVESYKKWCEENDLIPAFLVGPAAFEQGQGSLVEFQNGQSTVVGCVTPWMETVYDFRNRLQGKRELFSEDIHDKKTAARKIRLVNRFLSALETKMDLDDLVRWIGPGQAFFQAKVSGFRTKDENGDSEYFSSSIGKIDPDALAGPMSDIQAASKIQMNELQARYLSGGF